MLRKRELKLVMEQVDSEAGKTTRNRYRCDPFTATRILLWPLAYPCQWSYLETVFGKHASKLSDLFFEVLNSLYQSQHELVTTFRTSLMQTRCDLYAEAIVSSGGTLDSSVGFIDRPSGNSKYQRSVYIRHEWIHCLENQSVTTPHGLIFHLYGPVEGLRQDAYLYLKSQLEESLQYNLNLNALQFYIYGDQFYVLHPWILVEYPGLTATTEQKIHNAAMNVCRVALEWKYVEDKRA